MGKINVAIIGAGNCASSLVQGLHKYSEIDESSERIPGLMHNVLGGYALSDVNIVAAFDVDKEKVGLRLLPGVGDTIIPSSGKSSSSTTSCRKSSRIISVYQIANKKVRPQGTMKPADGRRLRKNITTARVTGSERD